jgi:hypothetical protein
LSSAASKNLEIYSYPGGYFPKNTNGALNKIASNLGGDIYEFVT